jgi:hypothetical protein
MSCLVEDLMGYITILNYLVVIACVRMLMLVKMLEILVRQVAIVMHVICKILVHNLLERRAERRIGLHLYGG